MKDAYLDEAVRIGDQLIASARKSSHGLSWQTIGLPTAHKEIPWIETDDIYAGASGIALFLLELHNATRDDRYLSAARQAMDWVEWYGKKHPTDNYALITGRLGTGFAFLKVFQITNDREYLQKAVAVAKQSKQLLQNPHRICDYIGGISGTLLGLLHIYDASRDPELLAIIEGYTEALIQGARYATVGMYWDRLPAQTQPLCGFAHGAAGIGFVFLELGHYFKNPAFYFVAEQAFAYENHYFDEGMHNWPDFRVNIYTPEKVAKLEVLYEQGQTSSLRQTGDMYAWCHGAPGIELSRLRANQLLDKPRYQDDIERARTRSRLKPNDSFTLCHGHAGNTDIFIGTPYAERVAKAALKQKYSLGRYIEGYHLGSPQEDLSLFNGIAGIGYFMLRMHKPIASILALQLDAQAEKPYPITLSQIKRSLIRNSFPRSLTIAEELASRKTKVFFQQADAGIKAFQQYLGLLLGRLSEKKGKALADAYALELAKASLSETIESQALLFIKDRLERRKAQGLLKQPERHLHTHVLSLAPECKVVRTELDGPYLLRQTASGVSETNISLFCATVLEAYGQPKTMETVSAELAKAYQVPNDQQAMLFEKVTQQSKEALTSAVLVLAS